MRADFKMHVLVHFNDFYFLDARADYSRSKDYLLPRVATVLRRLRKHLGGGVTVCMPGDFMAPSCLGKHSAGTHMLDLFDEIGVDFVVFGNHEFETRSPFSGASLARAISEHDVRWLSANFVPECSELELAFKAPGKVEPFHSIALAEDLQLVLVGVTMQDSYPAYGRAADPIPAAQAALASARRHVSATCPNETGIVPVALTHQELAADVALRDACPELFLIAGGHDHNQEYAEREKGPIVKAMSNLRTVRFHLLLYRRHDDSGPPMSATEIESLWGDARSRLLNRVFETLTHDDVLSAPTSVQALVRPPGYVGPLPPNLASFEAFIDDVRGREGFTILGNHEVGVVSHAINTSHPAFLKGVPESKSVRKRIAKWESTAPESRKTLFSSPFSLDGRDTEVRARSTPLGNLAADAVRSAAAEGSPIADIAFLNAGALRIDRELPRGEPISARTICDILFFENVVRVYTLTGAEVRDILATALRLRNRGPSVGHGDFLQISGLTVTWDGDALDRVCISDNRPPSLGELALDATQYSVATLEYVASTSKHYCAYFADRPFADGGSYQQSFTAAIARLGRLKGRDVLAHAMSVIESPRWVPGK